MPAAVRLYDATQHGTPLLPGIGSPNVWIGGRPAWRARLDIHACPMGGTPPHGIGMVMAGSASVFINGCPAVRLDDVVEEAAG